LTIRRSLLPALDFGSPPLADKQSFQGTNQVRHGILPIVLFRRGRICGRLGVTVVPYRNLQLPKQFVILPASFSPKPVFGSGYAKLARL
jgi:hypothetical protein